jgi:hypothetical protein
MHALSHCIVHVSKVGIEREWGQRPGDDALRPRAHALVHEAAQLQAMQPHERSMGRTLKLMSRAE